MNFSVETGMYPLGSCTMKYNPKVSEAIASSPRMREAHPLQHDSTVQGLLQVFHELSGMLCEITGMKRFALSTGRGRPGGVRRRPHDQEVPARQGEGRQDGDTRRGLCPRDQPGERGDGGVRGGQGPLERERPGHARVGEGEAHAQDRGDDAHGAQHARALRAGRARDLQGGPRRGRPDVLRRRQHERPAGQGEAWRHGVRRRPPQPPQDVRDPPRRGRAGAGPVGASGELQDYLPVPMVEKVGRGVPARLRAPEEHREAQGVLRELGDTPQGLLLHQAPRGGRAGQRLEPGGARGELPPLEAEHAGILHPRRRGDQEEARGDRLGEGRARRGGEDREGRSSTTASILPRSTSRSRWRRR